MARQFDTTHDTFACRFYQRLVRHSPCETILARVRIRLFDRLAAPIPGAPYLIVSGNREILADADSNADAIVQALAVPATCMVHWSRVPPKGQVKPQKADDFEYHLSVYVTIDDANTITDSSAPPSNSGSDSSAPSADAATKRLSNMGYGGHPTLTDQIKAFQIDLGLTDTQVTGNLQDAHATIKTRHDELNPPKRT